MKTLTPKAREAVRQHILFGLTEKEAMLAAGYTENTVNFKGAYIFKESIVQAEMARLRNSIDSGSESEDGSAGITFAQRIAPHVGKALKCMDNLMENGTEEMQHTASLSILLLARPAGQSISPMDFSKSLAAISRGLHGSTRKGNSK